MCPSMVRIGVQLIEILNQRQYFFRTSFELCSRLEAKYEG